MITMIKTQKDKEVLDRLMSKQDAKMYLEYDNNGSLSKIVSDVVKAKEAFKNNETVKPMNWVDLGIRRIQ
jgi:hypothetical protein